MHTAHFKQCMRLTHNTIYGIKSKQTSFKNVMHNARVSDNL